MRGGCERLHGWARYEQHQNRRKRLVVGHSTSLHVNWAASKLVGRLNVKIIREAWFLPESAQTEKEAQLDAGVTTDRKGNATGCPNRAHHIPWLEKTCLGIMLVCH
eukprot:scaffold206655_cov14-Tisochrysis_lutea.AAC.1